MRIFLSWSGAQSKAVADAFKVWLPSMIQYVEIFFSPEDIDKGSSWLSAITEELNQSSTALVILNPENINSNWINFEAGAVSKSAGHKRVCPIVFGMAPEDVKGPLENFQCTRFEKDDMFRLIKSINHAGYERRLDDLILENVFNKWWPDIETTVNDALLNNPINQEAKKLPKQEDVLLDIAVAVRRLERSFGDRATPTNLTMRRPLQDLIEELTTAASLHDVTNSNPEIEASYYKMYEILEFMAKRLMPLQDYEPLSSLRSAIKKMSDVPF